MKCWKGLWLALFVGACGCSIAPSVAFSPDGKQIAYAVANKGLGIKDTSDPSRKQFYAVGGVLDLCWSPTGSYLIWSDQPAVWSGARRPLPKVRLMEVVSGKVRSLPVSMSGPFAWASDESSVLGFAEEMNTSGDNLTKSTQHSLHATKAVRFDLGQNKKTEDLSLGYVGPLGVFPGTEKVVLAHENNNLQILDGDKLTVKVSLDDLDLTGYTLCPDGRALICKTKANIYGGQTTAFYLDAEGKRVDLPLPSAIAKTPFLPRQVSHLIGIGADAHWLVELVQKDLSKFPVLRDVLVIESAAVGSRERQDAQEHFAKYGEKAVVKDTYTLVDRSTGASRVILTVPSSAFSANSHLTAHGHPRETCSRFLRRTAIAARFGW